MPAREADGRIVGVSPAKITRPAPKGILERRRLLGALDALRSRTVVWVSGPAGSGKTTLVSSYVASRKLPCLWYQVDEGDSDLATFFYYLGLAGKHAAPRRKRPLPLLTPEYMLGVPTFSRRFFEDLCGRLPVPSVLVFDNYQEVPSTAPLHEALLQGVSAVPEGVNVIVLSRGEPPGTFARLRANNRVAGLCWEELRLTEAESKALSRLYAETNLSRKAVEELHERTAGWAAGLVLLLTGGVGDPGRGPAPETSQEVFDYFAGEVFDRTDAGTRDFLLKTSFLPSMTSRMAYALSGHEKADVTLKSLYRLHYFTDRLPGPEPAYRFHPLFREFLLARAGQAFREKEIRELKDEAARLLEEEGRHEEAVGLLVEAGDWPALVRLVLGQAPVLVGQGRFGVLEGWLRSLPGELVEKTPWLLYWMGVCRMPFDQGRSEDRFERAFRRFWRSGDAAGAFLSWSGIVDSISFGFEDFRRLDRWIPRLDAMVARFGAFPSKAIEARVASSMLIGLVIRNPGHPEFEKWAERALAQAAGDAAARAQALLQLLYHRLGAGDVGGVEHAFDSLKTLERSSDLPPLARLNAGMARTLYFHFLARPKECLETVQGSIEFANRTGVRVMDFMLLGNAVSSALGEEHEAEAESLLREMSARLGRARSWDRSLYHYQEAWLALLRNDLTEARRRVDISMSLSEQAGSPLSTELCYLLKAHVLHSAGDDKEAAACISRARAIGRRMRSRLSEFTCLLALAKFALDRDRASAMGHLRAAMAIGRGEGYVTTHFPWLRRTMARLCAAALEEGIEVEYVRGLIRKRGLVPESPPFQMENWPWPLKIYTLGRFSVVKDDSPLRFGAKAPRKPVEMLCALVALGGRGVRKERISDLLWPEAEGDAAHSNFTTTLLRLRRMLGSEEALEFTEGCLSLDAGLCWVDAWAFEHALSVADAGRVSGETSEHLEKALALYRGAFLADEDRDWSLSCRERLRRRYLEGVLRLGRHREAAGQWRQAVECYQKGLRVDDLAEELYQRLMISYRELGLKAEALSTYERCRRALQRAFHVEPAGETEAIHRKIRTAG